MNEDFQPFIFSKSLADKLSARFAFHSRHLFLFNVGNFAKIKSCRTRKSSLSNAMIHEPIVGSSSGFHRLTNHDTQILARDYCHVDKTKNRSFGAISLNFVAVREFITDCCICINCRVHLSLTVII